MLPPWSEWNGLASCSRFAPYDIKNNNKKITHVAAFLDEIQNQLTKQQPIAKTLGQIEKLTKLKMMYFG